MSGRNRRLLIAATALLGVTVVGGGTAAALAATGAGKQATSVVVSPGNTSVAVIHDAGHAFIALSGSDGEQRYRIADAGSVQAVPTGMRVVEMDNAIFVVDHDAGRVFEIDTQTSEPERDWQFRPPIDVLGAADGSLVVLEATTAVAEIISVPKSRQPIRIGEAGDTVALSRVGDEIVAANSTTDTLFTVTGDDPTREIDLPRWPAEEIVPRTTSGSRFAILRRAAHEANLVLADIATGTAHIVPIEADLPRDPMLFATDAAAFVPDPSAGHVLVIDSDGGGSREVDVDVGQEPGRFDLFVRNGELWLNNPDDDQSVVVGAGGNVAVVEKSAPLRPVPPKRTRPPAHEVGAVEPPLAPHASGSTGKPPPARAIVDAGGASEQRRPQPVAIPNAPPATTVAEPGIPLPPDAPHADVDIDDGSVTIAWDEPDLEGKTLHGYRVDMHSVADGSVLARFEANSTALRIPSDVLELDRDHEPDYAFTVSTVAADSKRLVESRPSRASAPIDAYRRPETSPVAPATVNGGRSVSSELENARAQIKATNAAGASPSAIAGAGSVVAGLAILGGLAVPAGIVVVRPRRHSIYDEQGAMR